MKKVAILLSVALVFGIASATFAADPAKISGEVVFKGMYGNDAVDTGIAQKTWETAKLSASGNLNPQMGYTFGIKYDMPSAPGGQTNIFPGSANGLTLGIDKAAITYKHASMPLSVTLGKNAIVGARTFYWDTLSNNLGAEGVALKYDAAKNLSIQALVQPNDKDDDAAVTLQNIWADYKAPFGEFGLNVKRSRPSAGADPVMDYSVEGSVPVKGTPITVVGELVKLDASDEMNYIVGAKAVLGANTLFVETTDNATPYNYDADGRSANLTAGKATAIGFSRNIAGADASVKYAMFEDESSKLTGELKVKF